MRGGDERWIRTDRRISFESICRQGRDKIDAFSGLS
jgi:hypothetical protein